MQQKNKNEQLFPKGFFKQFKDKDSFQDYFSSIFKQGIEEMLISILKLHVIPAQAGTAPLLSCSICS